MIQLTPLEKTVAGKELIQMGITEGILKGLEKGRIEGIEKGLEKGRVEGIEKGLRKGRIEGIEKGELIGKIHLAQRLLKCPITQKKKLLKQSPKELRAVLKQLEAELMIV